MKKWLVPIATALGIGLFMPGVAWAQATSKGPTLRTGPTTMTAMDYVEIQQLANRFAFAIDSGSNNGYDFADLFSADGEFMRPPVRGREPLAALARGGRVGPLNLGHYSMNHVIEPTPEGAIGRQYLIEVNFDAGNPPAGGRGNGPARPPGERPIDRLGRKGGDLGQVGGHYDDVYVKTPVGWRFRRREFIPSKSGPVAALSAPPPMPAPGTSAAVPAPAPAASYVAPTMQSSLTALDYIEIAQLVASYGHAVDSGFGKGENGAAYADIFAPGAGFGGATTPDQLAALARSQPRGPDWVRHYLTNLVIEPTPEGAKGKEYLVEFDNEPNGKPTVIFLGGHYEDTYVKLADGWHFKTRRLFAPRPGS